MDPKMIEMNNLRVLNDYLNQTIDALSRQPRLGHGLPVNGVGGLGFSPFGGVPATAGAIGTDTVWNAWPGSSGGIGGLGGTLAPQVAHGAFGPGFGPFGGFGSLGTMAGSQLPMYGASFGAWDPYLAQRSLGTTPFGGWHAGGWQPSWSPLAEATRQAQVTNALAARTQVLEAMCRACGIPV